MPFKFDTSPHSLSSIPKDKSQFIKDADSLISDITKKWKQGKKYSYTLNNGSKENVQAYSQTIDNEYWLSRVSLHKNQSYDKFLKYLIGVDDDDPTKVSDLFQHTKYETEYIHVLDKWEPIPLDSFEGHEEIIQQNPDLASNWCSLKAYYELGAPLKTREFIEFLLVSPPLSDDPNKAAYVIQLVANKESESANVRGVYVSIERIRLLEDNETIEWIMCTSSDSGGNVPKWLQNSMIAKSVSADVPSFLNWLEGK